jgi:hypothetical protein
LYRRGIPSGSALNVNKVLRNASNIFPSLSGSFRNALKVFRNVSKVFGNASGSF